MNHVTLSREVLTHNSVCCYALQKCKCSQMFLALYACSHLPKLWLTFCKPLPGKKSLFRKQVHQQNKQVCVQLPTYADNVALSAFARHALPYCAQCSNWLIYPDGGAHSSKPAAVGSCWDRRTDARQMHRGCSAQYPDSANKQSINNFICIFRHISVALL